MDNKEKVNVKVKDTDEFKDLKKDVKHNANVYKILNILLWLLLLFWIGVCVTDFVLVKTSKEPIFCVNRKTNAYPDGNVDICTGVGYKIHHYDRESIKAFEFGPLWGKERLTDVK